MRKSEHSGTEKPVDHQRRLVLKWTGVALGTASAFGVLGLDLQQALAETGAVDLGSGDIGILNYAYALEQLEAAFYSEAVEKPYKGRDAYEHNVFVQIKAHEIEHREFLKKALGDKRIPDLKPNFAAIDFSDRMSVLKTASTFEDLGVSAYNGAGALLKDAKYLEAAATIVSVEARHAAILRDMLEPLGASFAGDDIVDANGLDVARSPAQVLALAAPFILTPISATQLTQL